MGSNDLSKQILLELINSRKTVEPRRMYNVFNCSHNVCIQSTQYTDTHTHNDQYETCVQLTK